MFVGKIQINLNFTFNILILDDSYNCQRCSSDYLLFYISHLSTLVATGDNTHVTEFRAEYIVFNTKALVPG